MQYFYTRRNIIIGFAAPVALVCFFAWYTHRNMQRAKKESEIVNTTLRSINSLDNILDDMQDLETGQRGFIISGERKFLDPYHNALRRLQNDTAYLKTLLANYPERSAVFTDLLGLIRKKIAFATSSVKTRDEKGYDSAYIQVQSAEGRRIMDSIRGTLSRLENADRRSLEQSNAERENAARNTASLFNILTGGCLVLLGLLFWRIILDQRKEERSQKRIAHLAGLVNQSTVAIISADLGYTIKSWNYGAELLYRHTADEVIGKKDINLLLPGLTPEDQAVVEQHLEDYGYWSGEMQHRNKEGKQFDVFSSITRTKDKSGKPDGLVIVNRDITERKKLEERLKQFNEELEEQVRIKTAEIRQSREDLETSEKNLRHVLSSTADNFYVIDKHYTITLINRAAEKNLKKAWGKPVGVGSNILELLPDTDEPIKDSFKRVLAGEKVEYELHLSIQGLPTWVLVTYTPVRNEYGDITGASVVTKDITGRKKAEETLILSERTRKLIMDSSLDAMVCMDTSGYITEWTAQAEKTFGWKATEMIGKRLSDTIIPVQYRQQHLDGLSRYLKTGEAPVFNKLLELTALDSSGNEFPVELTIVSIRQEGSEFFCGFLRNISERKKAQKEIEESEEKYRTLVQQATAGIFISGLDGKFITVNPAGCAMSQYTEKELMQMTIYDLAVPEDLARNPFHFNELRQGKTVVTERIMKRKDGKIIDVEINAKLLANGRMLVFVQDITERKKGEEALRQSEEKYRSLVEQAADTIAIFDRTGKFIDVNSSATQLLGYTRDEFRQMSLSDVLLSEDLKDNPVRFDVLEKGESTIRQRRLRRKDGSFVETEVNAKKLPDGRFLGLVRDLTERIRAKQQIEKEKMLADSLINSLPGLFYLFDRNGKYIRWNRYKETITGYSGEEISHMNPLDFFEGPEKEMIRQRIEEGFETGQTSVEAHVVKKSGEKVPFYFTGIAVMYEGKPCLMGVGIDITERKKAEEELEQSYEAIRQLTGHLQNIREEERTHIAREIHDELGQQLTVLKMDVAWLNKKIHTDDTLIKQKLQNLAKLLDGTVKTVRRISSELRPSLLDDLGLVAAMDWHLKEFEQHSGLKTEFEETGNEWPLTDSVKTGLFRIFQESLTNVARHADARKVKVSLHRKKDQLVLSVEDDGQGFNMGDAFGKRTLGILGMKERTSMMGGNYEIMSVPGKGTKVLVSVPLMTEPSMSK